MTPSPSETRYLLDTNILSDLIRHPQGRVSRCVALTGEQHVCTSIVVAAELRYGAAKRGSERLSRQVQAVLGCLEIVPLETPADAAYGALRAELERRGQLIGPNDLLIAGQALSMGYVLVTDNESEFRRIPDLPVENWLR
jgi:tRNA(fMet)-specific endonuclease VapC